MRTVLVPVYAHFRRRCRDSQQAEDLTQGFCARLIEKDDLRGRRFGELLRSEIAETVADPAEVDAEILSLFSAVRP